MEAIEGLRETILEYKRLNAGGPYNALYGLLIYNKDTHELWVDEHFDVGHNSYNRYDDENVICLSRLMEDRGIKITMQNVQDFVEEL